MCQDYLNNSVSDTTMRCILQLATGTPADGLQDFALYFVAIVLSMILIFGIFSLMMIIAKIMRKP